MFISPSEPQLATALSTEQRVVRQRLDAKLDGEPGAQDSRVYSLRNGPKRPPQQVGGQRMASTVTLFAIFLFLVTSCHHVSFLVTMMFNPALELRDTFAIISYFVTSCHYLSCRVP